jgi:hypothetical protein
MYVCVFVCVRASVCVHITLKLHDYRDCIHNIRDGLDAVLFFYYYYYYYYLYIHEHNCRRFTVVVYIKRAFASPINII